MIRYHVTLPLVHAHRVNVRLTLDAGPGPHLDLAMPVWAPGSYLVREFARNVLDLTARDGRGTPLTATKIDKNTWRVAVRAATPVEVNYCLYANEPSVRTSHVDADHAFLSPPATFLRVCGRTDEPHEVTVAPPAGWEVFTGLPRKADAWRAADYDALVDGPLEVGPHRVLSFEHHGVPHRIVLAGKAQVDPEKLVSDVRRVVAEVASVFGEIPFPEYVFLLLFVDGGGGGLEHGNSSACMISRWDLGRKEKYRDFLSLLAHEYFHAWNGKRFRPTALGPFDYDRENYTRDLWVAEGFTSYYDGLSVLRAGLTDGVGDSLRSYAEAFRTEAERPGGRRTSLSRASFDAWIKHYRPDENSANSTVSYYSKGALVAFLLDLRIRRLSRGSASLADVLRLGWARFAARGQGYPEGAVEALASEMAGSDLHSFFEAYVHGTEALDPEPDLAWVGLKLERMPRTVEDRGLARDERGFALEPWLGLTTKADGELCRVDTVLEGGPAFLAGLNHGDVILALDDLRVGPATFQDRLDRTSSPVRVTLWRGQTLRTLLVQPDLRRVEEWRLLPVPSPTPAQRAAFRTWSGWEHPHPPDEPPGDRSSDRPRRSPD